MISLFQTNTPLPSVMVVCPGCTVDQVPLGYQAVTDEMAVKELKEIRGAQGRLDHRDLLLLRVLLV